VTDFLEINFYHNDLKSWMYGLAAIIISYLIMRIIKGILYKRIYSVSQKTETNVDDLIAELIKKVKNIILLLLAIFIGSFFLSLPEKISGILHKIIIISLLIQAGITGTTLVQFWVDRYKKRKMAEDAASVTTFTALGFLLRMVLWSVLLLLALDNLGFNITTLVAGLGVGGIAVALAVQNVLGDLFASLSIVLDKPFVIGDFIIIDNYLGSVEHIGLKTTRLRSLSGEQLVISNGDLLKSRIRNYKRMYERRVVFSLGVIYQTPLEKLKQIPEMIKEIIENRIIRIFSQTIYEGLDNDILSKFSSTPLTINKVSGSSDGAITGWSFETEIPVINKLMDIPKSVLTPIPGVLKAGQWAYAPSGVPIAMLTGWYATQKITNSRYA